MRRSPEELEREIRHHNRLYWIDNAPEISDEEYDRLVRELERLAPDSPVLAEIAAGAATTDELGDSVRHEQPMLSLDKCYTEEVLGRWAQNFEGPIVTSPKIDGVAVSLIFGGRGHLLRAATRGDGRQGEDITANARALLPIPGRIDLKKLGLSPSAARVNAVEIRGEVFLTLSEFERFKNVAASPRNLAAGTLKRKHPSADLPRLSFFAYDLLGSPAKSEWDKLALLGELGVQPVQARLIGRDELQDSYLEWVARRPTLDFELDGVVYKCDSLDEQARLGSTAHHPRYAIAYKFQGDTGESQLADVEWGVSRTGAITPVAVVTPPVLLSGAMIKRCSLHNLGIVRKLSLSLGDTVVVTRRGGVIPHIEESRGGGTIPVIPPRECPSCAGPVVVREDLLLCAQPADCRGARLGTLEHYVSTIRLEGFGPKVLAQLHDRGMVKEPADLYKLSAAKLASLDLVGDVLARKLTHRIRERRHLTLPVFLQALGIPVLGKSMAEQLALKYRSLRALRALSEEDLIGPGLRETTARQLVEGLARQGKRIDALLEYVTVEEREHDDGAVGGPLSGKSVLFTGKLMTLSRTEAQERVSQAGGENASGVSKNLDILVIGDGDSSLRGAHAKSSKQRKAERYLKEGHPIEIITERELLERIE